LLTYGFLKAAFRPADEICRLRTLQRHRKNLVESVSMRTQHIQKALSEMGVQLHHVLTDILGESGLRILDSILAGERDPVYLAGLVDRRVKKGTEEIVAALKGNYQQEQLFVIAQTLETVRAEQRQIAACDVHILSQLEKLSGPPKPATDGPTPAEAQLSAQVRLPAKVPGKRRVKPRSPKTLYENSLREQLKRILGVDLTQIPGLGVLAVLTLLSEIGTNMNKWHSAKAFASWLGLCPNNKISGGRVLSSRTKHVVSRTATILRMAAMTVRRSQTPLGAFYRRKQAHLGAPKAITATARKIACLIYSLIKEQKEYQEQDLTAYTIDYKKRAIAILRKRAADLDCELVSLQKAA
jgi:transposase